MNAPMTATERYADAASNGVQNDAIHAGAFVKGWATKLFRLKYANDPKEYQFVLDTFKTMAVKLFRRMKWGNDSQAYTLASKVLDYYLFDVCPACMGKGYEVMAGTPMLSDVPCKVCKGEKIRNMEGKGEWAARADILLGYIKDAEREGGAEILRYLRKETDALSIYTVLQECNKKAHNLSSV